MKNLREILMQRRSIRKYTTDLITKDEQKSILEAGLMAPTSKNSRPWNFIVVDDKETLEQLGKCNKFGAMSVAGCAMAVVVVADSSLSEAWIEDCSIAAAFMQLRVEELGMGSCWVQIRERMFDENTTAQQYVKNLLSIPEEMEVECILTIGHKAEERKPLDPEKALWERVHQNKW